MSKKRPAPMIRRRHAGTAAGQPGGKGPKKTRRAKKAMGKLPPSPPPQESPVPRGKTEVRKILAAWGRMTLAGVRKHMPRESPQGAG